MTQATVGVAWRLASTFGNLLSKSSVGWAISVRSGTQEVAALADGWAQAPWESSGGVPMTPDTPVHIASMSKIVTNLGIRLMVVQWNDAVQNQVWQSTGPAIGADSGGYWTTVPPGVLEWVSEPVPLGPLSNLFQRARARVEFINLDSTPVMDLVWDKVPPPWGPGVYASGAAAGFALSTQGLILPTNPGNTPDITLADLMTHHTGINIDKVSSWGPLGGTATPPADTSPLWQAISDTFLRGVEPGQQPGTTTTYAGYPGYKNQHYQILRAILEHCVGYDYDWWCQVFIWPAVSGQDFTWPAVDPWNVPSSFASQPQCVDSSPTSCLYYPRVVPNPGIDRSGSPAPGGSLFDFHTIAGAFGWFASARSLTAMLAAAQSGAILGSADTSTLPILSDTSTLLQNPEGLINFGASGMFPETAIGHNGEWGYDGNHSRGLAFVTTMSGIAAAFVINTDSPDIDIEDYGNVYNAFASALQPLLSVDQGRYTSRGASVRNPFGFGVMRGGLSLSLGPFVPGSLVGAELPTATTSTVDDTPIMIVPTSETLMGPGGWRGPTISIQPNYLTAALFDDQTQAQISLAAQLAVSATASRPANFNPGNGNGMRWRLQTQQNPPQGWWLLDGRGKLEKVPGFEQGGIASSGTCNVPDLSTVVPSNLTNNYALQFDAYLSVLTDGTYTFTVTSSNGSVLWIGDELVIANDGQHGSQTVSGTVGLKAGFHPFRLGYFQATGSPALDVQWMGPDFLQTDMPASAFVLPPDGVEPTTDYIESPTDQSSSTTSGLKWSLYAVREVGYSRLPVIDSNCPLIATGRSSDFGDPIGNPIVQMASDATGSVVLPASQSFVVRFTGLLNVPGDDTYTFTLTSDDGSRMWLNGIPVVDNDGTHGSQAETGVVALKQGWHRIQLDYYQEGGGMALSASWSNSSSSPTSMATALYTD